MRHCFWIGYSLADLKFMSHICDCNHRNITLITSLSLTVFLGQFLPLLLLIYGYNVLQTMSASSTMTTCHTLNGLTERLQVLWLLMTLFWGHTLVDYGGKCFFTIILCRPFSILNRSPNNYGEYCSHSAQTTNMYLNSGTVSIHLDDYSLWLVYERFMVAPSSTISSKNSRQVFSCQS